MSKLNYDLLNPKCHYWLLGSRVPYLGFSSQIYILFLPKPCRNSNVQAPHSYLWVLFQSEPCSYNDFIPLQPSRFHPSNCCESTVFLHKALTNCSDENSRIFLTSCHSSCTSAMFTVSPPPHFNHFQSAWNLKFTVVFFSIHLFS